MQSFGERAAVRFTSPKLLTAEYAKNSREERREEQELGPVLRLCIGSPAQ